MKKKFMDLQSRISEKEINKKGKKDRKNRKKEKEMRTSKEQKGRKQFKSIGSGWFE